MATPGTPLDTPKADTVDAGQSDTEMDGVETANDKTLSPELYESMQALLDALYDYRDADGSDPSKAFHKRPNKRNFPDYYETIQEPVAFSNIKGKIQHRQYNGFEEFVRDLALIWHNAMVYNRPDARAYVDAGTIRDVMEAELKKLVEANQVTMEQMAWPDLGEIPAADAEEEADEDVESDKEGEEDEEEAENSETEVSKPRRRARRPSTAKKGETQADGANTRRGRPPKVDTPLEARIKNVLKAIRKPKFDTGVPMVYHFEKLPDKNQLPDYYAAIRTPIALEQIKKSLKRKRYHNFDQCIADLNLMFENAKAYNEDDSEVFQAAVQLQEIARQTAEEEKAKPDDEYAFEEGRKPKPAGITHNGKLWKVGDWVLIRNRNDVTKPIVAQIYRTWEDSSGRDWVNACWYYRPEQTIHHFEKHFWPNEVLKTSQYRDHPIEEVLDKCFVMFFTRFTRGRPRGLDADTEVFVCEARYNEEKHKINKIKTWSSCLPDEVRDKDYEMDLFETQRRIKKLPSPLEHKSSEAKDDGTLPEPRMGAEDAPPIEGGVYKGPRDDNQSPPPSPTPSPPPPPPVQPVRQISHTPGRDTPSKMNRGAEVDSAMASASRAFGAGSGNQSQATFVQQRQQHSSASPAPHAQGQYQQYSQGGAQYAGGQGTPSSQRQNYGSYRPDQAQQRQPVPGAMAHRPSDVMTLGPAANAQIPLEVREKLQTNDQGEVLFFSQPPQPQAFESKIPSELRTSLRYRIERVRQRLLERQEAEEASEEVNSTAVQTNGLTSANGDSAKRSSESDADTGAVVKRARTDAGGKPRWTTNPITLADIDLANPESSIDKIDPARVNPATDLLYMRQWGVGYKDFLKSACARNLQLWSGLVPQDQLVKVMEESIKGVMGSVQQTVVGQVVRTAEKKKAELEYYEQKRKAFNKQPEFYLEDRDPLYCGLSWQGPNPYAFNGGTGVSRRD